MRLAKLAAFLPLPLSNHRLGDGLACVWDDLGVGLAPITDLVAVCYSMSLSNHRLGDKLADVIVEVRDHLGQSIMPLDRYHMFSRGVFEVGRQTVISGQYYEEIPYYGPPRPAGQDQGGIMEITKFYEWKIIDSPRVRLTVAV